LAAWLVVLQGFLAALASAQAGAMLISAPADAAVICHAASSAGPIDTPAGDATNKAKQALHLCCACCTAAVATAPAAPNSARPEPLSASAHRTARGFILVAARGLIRAGPSQGPPKLA
jgi:hypothetical protein